MVDHNRQLHFDGLRSILAFIVIFEHLMTVFFPISMINEITPRVSANFLENFLVFGPINLFYAGYLAVSVFFVLSGFLLSQSLNKVDNLISIDAIWFMLRRYLRFAIPVLVILLVATILAQNGFFYFHEYLDKYGHAGYPIFDKGSPPTFISAIEGGFYRSIFLFEGRINPVLWTVTAEILGSFLVLALMLTKQNKLSSTIKTFAYWGSLALCLVFLWDNVLVGFVIGIICYELQLRIRNVRMGRILGITIAILIMAVTSFISVKGGPTNPFTLIKFDFHASMYNYIIYAWFAGGLIMTICLTRRLQRYLSNSILVFLGKCSFGLYLIHYMVLTTVGLRISDILGPETPVAFYSASVATIILSIVFGALFYKYVEKPALKICNLFSTGTRVRLFYSTKNLV